MYQTQGKSFPFKEQKEVTFFQSSPSENEKSYTNHKGDNQVGIGQVYQHSQKIDDEEVKEPSEHSSLAQQAGLQKEQLQANMKILQKLWEYRYVRLCDYALKTNDWFRLFNFLSEFKLKCIDLVKKLILGGIQNVKGVDDIDHRYNLKGNGQDGIFLEDGIIIRIARVKTKLKQNGTGAGFDNNAVKALHQEFLSHNILNNLSLSLARDMPKLPRIRVPLTCLVKYLGFTALCQADSACEGLQTLVHGPTGTIYQYREQYMQLLRVLGSCLNLKEFSMLSSDKKSVTIPFSLTLQLHKVGKYLPHERFLSIINKNSILYPDTGSIELPSPQFYLVNVAKLWPLFIDSDIIKSVGYLRPQIVISSRTPLSNVVFCQVSERADPQGQLQLADACKRVKEDHISSLAKMLDNTTVFLVDSSGIEQLLHQYGINMRYMGALAEKVQLDFNKKILETEMIARACKRYFFRTFHEIGDENKLIGPNFLSQFRECFVDFLNLLFIKSKQGQHLYKHFIYPQVGRYYDYKITSYPPEMPGGGILHALCFHFGVRLKIIDYPFFQNLESIFNTAHILEIHSSARSYDLDTAEIKQVCRRYKQKRKAGKLEQSIRELRILAKLHSLASPEGCQAVGPLPQAYFWTELAQVHFRRKEDELARSCAELALKAIPQKHSDSIRPFQLLMKYYMKRKQVNKGVEYYQKSLNYLGYHLGTNHPMTITVYNSFAYEQLQSHDPSKCEKMFLKSLEICERSLGYTHATSSQILLQLAELPLSAEKKINYYLQGLNVLQNLEGGEAQSQQMRRVCMRLAERYESTGNLQKMIQYAKRSGYWQLQIKGESRQQLYKNVLLLANRPPIDPPQAAFLAYYAFRSYAFLQPKQTRQYLYKLFVSIRDQLIHSQKAQVRLMQTLRSDKANPLTISELIKNTLNHLAYELPQLINKPNFYKRIFSAIDPDDKKLRASIQAFIEITSSIGEDKTEKILTKHVRNE